MGPLGDKVYAVLVSHILSVVVYRKISIRQLNAVLCRSSMSIQLVLFMSLSVVISLLSKVQTTEKLVRALKIQL